MPKLRTEIFVTGAKTLEIQELVSGGAITAWTDPGHLKKLTLADAPNMVESVNSGGEMIDDKVGSDNTRFIATFMQASKVVIDLLRNARAKYFRVYILCNLPNGSVQETVIGCARIIPKVGLDFSAATERDLEFEIVCLKPKAVYTVAPTDYNNNASDGPYYYVLIETAGAAKNEPTDTNGTAYTAVM